MRPLMQKLKSDGVGLGLGIIAKADNLLR